jgi:hypothetical protein
VKTGGAFGVNQFAVFGDFKDAATGAHQLHISAWKFLFDPRLQLESPGSIASGITVFDSDVHPLSPYDLAAYERMTNDARSVAEHDRDPQFFVNLRAAQMRKKRFIVDFGARG